MSGIPELLYHTTLTVLGKDGETAAPTRSVYVLGTHATVEAAKAFASKALQDLGYEPSDFVQYDVRDGTQPLAHGDGVVVYAKAPAGQEFIVGLDTTPNDQGFLAGPDGTIQLSAHPDNDGKREKDLARHLHYVLQTAIDYNAWVGDAFEKTDIEGCYVHRADAFAAAKKCLKGTGYDFAQYDQRDDLRETDEWPFGDDVLVHAVSQSGENFSVSVCTIPGAHKKHSKKNGKQ
ncbi:hypothetical protein SPBR_05255 [Sporothrix brasiliensis 5110]|uniref:Uncharacterized protein n=1 Tax=Sporothrix brasiliensis 5110 TaxID=1398154 RepID=A0A0C2ILA3_9PEZI|nr:uncharacterized protein SPBR_05255 [Sporothrix brasiliensis 5110]KIH87760.1 hypothetical protein SPBR_05255 [Sporothrix brasiliensis 5110]